MNRKEFEGIRDIWAKPASFDIPILQAAMDKLGIERPLCLRAENFRHWQCFATLRRTVTFIEKEFNEHTEFKKVPTHTALADAEDQAVQANIILSVLHAWRADHRETQELRNTLQDYMNKQEARKEKRAIARRKKKSSKK
jgi:hypothetical protein